MSIDGTSTSTITNLPKQHISSLIRIFGSPEHKYSGIAMLPLKRHSFKKKNSWSKYCKEIQQNLNFFP